MRLFFLDACAVARRYFDDIGSGNIRQLFEMADSLALAPEIVKPEVVSALISSYNGRFISREEMSNALLLFEKDLRESHLLVWEMYDRHFDEAVDVLKRHKIVEEGEPGGGKAGIGGADALYLAMASELSERGRTQGDPLIFVTADRALYRCACDEPGLEVFHFWSCQCPQCGKVFIPRKGLENTCEGCGWVCTRCAVENCQSELNVEGTLFGGR